MTLIYRLLLQLDRKTGEKLDKMANLLEMSKNKTVAKAINKLYESEEIQEKIKEEEEKRIEGENYGD